MPIRPTSSSTRLPRAGRRQDSWPDASCRLETRVIGISADDPAASLEPASAPCSPVSGTLLGVGADRFDAAAVEVDDRFVGAGYGVPDRCLPRGDTLVARTEGLFLDPTYTAKAMAGLMAVSEPARSGSDRRSSSGTPAVRWGCSREVDLPSRGSIRVASTIERTSEWH